MKRPPTLQAAGIQLQDPARGGRDPRPAAAPAAFQPSGNREVTRVVAPLDDSLTRIGVVPTVSFSPAGEIQPDKAPVPDPRGMRRPDTSEPAVIVLQPQLVAALADDGRS